MTSHRLRVFLAGCLAAVAWPAMAQLVPISKVLGVWEVTDVVRRQGAEPSDLAVQGYANMIGTQTPSQEASRSMCQLPNCRR